MICVDPPNHISTSITEGVVEEIDLFGPATVRFRLLLRMEEVLPAVEEPIGRCRHSLMVEGIDIVEWEARFDCGDTENAVDAIEQSSGAACFQNQFMWEHKHARLRQEVGI